MKIIWLGLFLALAVIACKNQKDSVNTLENMKESEVINLSDTVHNSKNSLDWKGTYRGIMPCADCMGMQLELTLKDDGVYETRTLYIGKSDSIFVQEGRYEWSSQGDKIICRINNRLITQLKVGENYVQHMGTQDKVPTGGTKDLYILYKDKSPILYTYWKAYEIMGKKVEELELSKTPYLLIEKNSFSATGGCNSIFGAFSFSEKGQKVKFSEIAASEMECQFQDLDSELIDALDRSQQFILKDGELQLIVGKAMPLARFKAVMK